MSSFTPPSKPAFLKWVKIPDEALPILAQTDNKTQYDRLCGAIVRYMMSGKVEEVQKGIRMAYASLIPGIDRIRRGAKNKFEGLSTDENSPSPGEKADENPRDYEREPDKNTEIFPWDFGAESECKTEHKNDSGFCDLPSPIPAGTNDFVGNQPQNQYDKHLSNQKGKHLNNRRYESESVSESEGVAGGKLDEKTRMRLATASNKLKVLRKIDEADAKRIVWDRYRDGGMPAVEAEVALTTDPIFEERLRGQGGQE